MCFRGSFWFISLPFIAVVWCINSLLSLWCDSAHSLKVCWKRFHQHKSSWLLEPQFTEIAYYANKNFAFFSPAASWWELLGGENSCRLMDDKMSRLVRNRHTSPSAFTVYSNETICMLLRIERKLSDWLLFRFSAQFNESSLNFRSMISALINLNFPCAQLCFSSRFANKSCKQIEEVSDLNIPLATWRVVNASRKANRLQSSSLRLDWSGRLFSIISLSQASAYFNLRQYGNIWRQQFLTEFIRERQMVKQIADPATLMRIVRDFRLIDKCVDE